jgi:hypothetical protein
MVHYTGVDPEGVDQNILLKKALGGWSTSFKNQIKIKIPPPFENFWIFLYSTSNNSL